LLEVSRLAQAGHQQIDLHEVDLSRSPISAIAPKGATMEAGNRPQGQTTHDRTPVNRVHRRTDETKHAFKTTEFMLTVATIVGILVAAALIKGGDTEGTDEFIASQAWLYVAVVVLGYNISRGAAKSGSYAEDRDDDRR
jgi:hypothetical protein